MKTSELRGSALDWAVAQCRGFEGVDEDQWLLRDGIADMPLSAYNPSTDWSQGGPIIEREFIHLHGGAKSNGDSDWCALRVKDDKSACHKGHGPTPLIAAMRCFVASRLGDEVNIPEELQ